MTTKTPNQVARPNALLKKERGIRVLQGEPTDISIVDLIDQVRNTRIREQMYLPLPKSD